MLTERKRVTHRRRPFNTATTLTDIAESLMGDDRWRLTTEVGGRRHEKESCLSSADCYPWATPRWKTTRSHPFETFDLLRNEKWAAVLTEIVGIKPAPPAAPARPIARANVYEFKRRLAMLRR